MAQFARSVRPLLLRAVYLSAIAGALLASGVARPADAHAEARKKGGKNPKLETLGTHDKAKDQRTKQEVAIPLTQTCKATILLEPASNTVIYELNSQEPLPPASMVKLMTSYVVLKKLKEGAFQPTDVVTTSANASRIGGSQVYLKEHEQFTIAQLLEAVLIQSANDAAVALAEHMSGSSTGFAEIMNAEAQQLGMSKSTFYTPHGLPPAPGQMADLVSAADFAMLSKALITEFPEVLTLTSKVSAGFRDNTFEMRNHNHLLRMFPGCDGLKTGFYNEAGFNVTATALRNGLRMIAVVMGCPNRKIRENEAARLLSMGYAQYASKQLAKKGDSFGDSIPIANGTKLDVQPIAAADVRALVRLSDQKNVVTKKSLCPGLYAPVALGTSCGTVSYMIGDKEIAKVEAVIGEEIPEIGRVEKMKRYIGL